MISEETKLAEVERKKEYRNQRVLQAILCCTIVHWREKVVVFHSFEKGIYMYSAILKLSVHVYSSHAKILMGELPPNHFTRP